MLEVMTDQPLDQKVTEWLHKTGLPLELATAAAFKRWKFEVTHSAVYADPQTEKGREIDVVAYARDGTGLLQFYVVVECKASPSPWVVLVDPSASSITYASLGLASRRTRDALTVDSLNSRHPLGESLTMIHRNGYGLRQAFSKDNDPAYAASMAVLKAANAQLLESNSKTERYKFVIPLIVVDAPIYECIIAEDGSLSLRETSFSSFHFTAYIPDRADCVIRIVHKSEMEYLSRHLKRIAEASFNCLQYKVDEWVRSLTKGGGNSA